MGRRLLRLAPVIFMAEKKTEQTFEAALSELEEIVEKMERGDLPLEESVEAYTRGKRLAEVCRKKLDAAQAKIQKLEANGRLVEMTADETSL